MEVPLPVLVFPSFATPSPQRTVPELIEHIRALTAEIQELYRLNSLPWVIGYSGGKDSTCVVQLVWNALAALPPDQLTKPVYICSTDTLVENPIVAAWVRQSLDRINTTAPAQGLPFEAHLLQPEVKDTFWVNLIGKGYPAPRHMFRWCTERLKIWPANRFIKDVVRANGEVLLVLGTRKAESPRRANVMAQHVVGNVGDHLPHSQVQSLLYRGNLPNTLIYSPIEDWRDDEVWLYLMQYANPWGYSNKALFEMYQGATPDNECAFVVDGSTPSCGDSRFGCWVCTLVSRDRSMEAMILNDDEKAWMQPLLDLRNELDVYNDHDRRDFRRMSGKVQLFQRHSTNETLPIPGPYTRVWREKWLKKLLTAQKTARAQAPEGMNDITLITPAELSEIRRIWREDKHEFDDSLPRIYRKATGEIFKDPRPGADQSQLGSDEWSVLADLCQDDPMHLELMTKLLDTERQYATMGRRVGIFEALEKCFDSSSRSRDDAIAQAYHRHDLKTAAAEGDVEQVKALAEWGAIRFAAPPRAAEPEADYS
ncbi:DNA phosphorothioation system sulfurtransferase DndC [Nodosilinea nodulosa]|uniref:DNA phosphorothioation system sulfurtransferase DndC n=1 Tax=Nodosilinea nodulosa TaxID=416001 RepID=UPI000360C52C